MSEGDILDIDEVKEEVDEKEPPKEVETPLEKSAIVEESLSGGESSDGGEPKYKTSVLSDSEYNNLKKTLATIASLKSSLTGKESEVALQRIKLLEISIWDEMVKKFGFRSVEEAQSSGYTFGLRQLNVVECRKS